jgi:hypothetical protein
MYALLLVEVAETYPAKAATYRAAAEAALSRLRQQPWHSMFHQTVQLSWAAAAAHRLGKPEWRDDFTRVLLLSCYRVGPLAGLFQGCAALGYPTFRETVEAVSPWIEWLDDAVDLPLRSILENVLDKARMFITDQGLPEEGLETPEQPEAGLVGVAVYAAPQIFDLARIQSKLHLSQPGS